MRRPPIVTFGGLRVTLPPGGFLQAVETAEEAMAELDALTLSGSLDYQACDDAICYPPASVPLSFTLELERLDYQRAIRR